MSLASIPLVSPIARAAFGASCLLAPALAPAQAAAPAWAAELDSAILAAMSRSGTPGAQVAVVVGGRLAYSRGYGVADVETGRPVTARTLFRVGSVTKMVTAATLAQLAEDGTLDLAAPIARYLPELEGRAVGRVTTHQLLTHTAGWADNTQGNRMGEGALGEVMREVTDTVFFTEAGRVFSYANPGYAMAGYVAERAAGRRFGALADSLTLRATGMPRATFRPLEAMTHDFSQGHDGPRGARATILRPFRENTAQWAAGFLMASAEELARLAVALMDSGRVDGARGIPAGAVRRMTSAHQPIPGTAQSYGYGLRVGTANGRRTWSHGGTFDGFNAQVTMFPAERAAVIVLDNRTGSAVDEVVPFALRLAAGIAPAPAAAPAAPREPTPEERAALAGTYRQGRVTMRLADEGGSLRLVQGTRSLAVRLTGPDQLTATAPDGSPLRVIAVRDADGRVAYLLRSSRALARQP